MLDLVKKFCEITGYLLFIKKGAFLDWSLRDDFLKTAHAMASAVNAVEIAEYGVKL